MKNKKISIFLVTVLAAFTLCLSLPKIKVNAANENYTDLMYSHFNNTYFSERQDNTLFYLGNNFNVDFFGINTDYGDRSFGITNYTLREYNNNVRYCARYDAFGFYAFGQPSQNGLDFVVYNNALCDYVQYEFNDLLLPSSSTSINVPELLFNFLNSFSFTFDFNNATSINFELYIDMYRNNSVVDEESTTPEYIPSYDIYRIYTYFATPVIDKPFSVSILEQAFSGFKINELYFIDTQQYSSSSIERYVPYLVYVPRVILRVKPDDNAALGQVYIKENVPSTSSIINNYNYAVSAIREKNFYYSMLELVNSQISNTESVDGFYNGYYIGYEDGYDVGVNINSSPFNIITNTVESFLNLELFPNFRVYYLLLIALGFGLFGLLVKYALGG